MQIVSDYMKFTESENGESSSNSGRTRYVHLLINRRRTFILPFFLVVIILHLGDCHQSALLTKHSLSWFFFTILINVHFSISFFLVKKKHNEIHFFLPRNSCHHHSNLILFCFISLNRFFNVLFVICNFYYSSSFHFLFHFISHSFFTHHSTKKIALTERQSFHHSKELINEQEQNTINPKS